MALKTALIVDDSKLARITLRKKLDKIGVDVELAESASEAFDKIKASRPDIVFMDHLMPDIDGFEATQKIRAMGDYDDLPIVMCSGKDHDSYLDEARAIGANYTLIKPPTNEALDDIMQMDFASLSAVSAVGETAVAADSDDGLGDSVAEAMAAVDAVADDDDDMLISDDMDFEDDDELVVAAVPVVDEDAESDAALLVEAEAMLGLDGDDSDEATHYLSDEVMDDAVALETSLQTDDPLGLDGVDELPVAELIEDDEEALLEAAFAEPVSDTALADDLDIPLAMEVVEEECAADALDEAFNDQVDPAKPVAQQAVASEVAAPAIDMAEIESQIEAKVAALLVEEKAQILQDVQASVSEQVLTLSASAEVPTAEVDEAAVQVLLEQSLAARIPEISQTVSTDLMAQFTQLLEQRLQAFEVPAAVVDAAPIADIDVTDQVQAQVGEQLELRMADVTATLSQMQQSIDTFKQEDEALINDALTALQVTDSTVGADSLDAVIAQQASLEKKIGAPKAMSMAAIVLSLAALAAAALNFMQ